MRSERLMSGMVERMTPPSGSAWPVPTDARRAGPEAPA